MKKIRKTLAGILAAAVAVMNIPAAVLAEEAAPLNTGGNDLRLGHFDQSIRKFVDADGNIIVPKDHQNGVSLNERWSEYSPENYSKYDTTKLSDSLPAIKDQVCTGTCWAHAALAAIEFNGILNGTLPSAGSDFSEAHLAYFSKITDMNTSNRTYGDNSAFYTAPDNIRDYYHVYANGAVQWTAISSMAGGMGPIIEIPEWDIAENSDELYIINTAYEYIYDTISRSDYLGTSDGYIYYNDNGTEVSLSTSAYGVVYSLTSDILNTPPAESVRHERDAILTDAEQYAYNYTIGDPSSVNNIKAAIMEKGALTLSYYADNTSWMTDSKYGYYHPEEVFDAKNMSFQTNHTVTIVGWDDDYLPENFYCDYDEYSFTNGNGVTTTFSASELRPQSKGAWLCRNSWGSGFGNDGYFYISYEEPELEEFFSYDVAPIGTYGDNIYQYDGVMDGWNYKSDLGFTIANIFTADAADTITAAGFYSFDTNTTYTISIYRGVEDGQPMSGTLASTVSGTAVYSGYHTVDLTTPVALEEGEKFSIVLSTNDTLCFVDNYSSSAGQSFIGFADAASYNPRMYDAYEVNDNYKFNVCLKALTAGDDEVLVEAPENIDAVIGDGKALLFWDPVKDAEKYTVYYYNDITANPPEYVVMGDVTSNCRMMNTLTNDHTYLFAVTATVDGVESELSDNCAVIPKAGAAIVSSVSGIEAETGDGQVTLAWDALKGVTSYNVYYGTANNFYLGTKYGTVSGNSCVITGLTNNTTYYFWVEGNYIHGETSLRSDSVSAVPASSDSKPAAPTGITAENNHDDEGNIIFEWNAVENADSYTVYYALASSPDDLTSLGDNTSPEMWVCGFAENEEYYIYVTATVDGVESDLSEPFSFILPETPVLYGYQSGSGIVDLYWDNVENADYYNIYFRKEADEVWDYAGYSDDLAEDEVIYIDGLEEGTAYCFTIAAVKNGIESHYADQLTITISPSLSITSQPKSMTVIGGTKVTFAVQASGTGLAYSWQYNDGSVWKNVPTDSNIYISGGTLGSVMSVCNTAKYKDCSFRCIVTDSSGNSVTSDAAVLTFYNESNITVGAVEQLSTDNLVNYVNYFTSLYSSDTYVLTSAQLRAIELVLKADYAAA